MLARTTSRTGRLARTLVRLVLAFALVMPSIVAQAAEPPAADTPWVRVASMNHARYGATATLLPNGHVVVAGGYDGTDYLSSIEEYDPIADTWTEVGDLSAPRAYLTANLLPRGDIAFVGGEATSGALANVDLMNVDTGAISAGPWMPIARSRHVARLRDYNGYLIVSGGMGADDQPIVDTNWLNTQDSVNWNDGTWGPLDVPRAGARINPTGWLNAIITGGTTETADIWYWDDVCSSAVGTMSSPRLRHTATGTGTGILLAGGNDGTSTLETADLLNMSDFTVADVSPMPVARESHTADLLGDGQVVLVGGCDASGTALASTSVFNPSAKAWADGPDMNDARADHLTVVLKNGNLLVIGGRDDAGALASCEVYDVSLDRPLAADDSGSCAEDTSCTVDVLANDSDPFGNALEAAIAVAPAHGSVVVSGEGAVNYRPEPDFNGTDTIVYRTTNSHFVSDLATLTVTVTPVADVPRSLPDTITMATRKVRPADGSGDGDFGWASALTTNTAVVSEPWRRGMAGVVHVYARSGSDWTEEATLTVPPTARDSFGYSLAIDGDTIAVGNDSAQVGDEMNVGAVHVFRKSGSTWSEEASIAAPTVSTNEFFGVAVALQGDRLVVGSNQHSPGGMAWVYKRIGSAWSVESTLAADVPVDYASFGSSVAIQGDTVVVGAPDESNVNGSNAGAAYVFRRTESGWSQAARMLSPDAGDNSFGSTVALSGTTALIGSYGYDAPGRDNMGAAYAYVGSGATWTCQARLTAGDAQANDYFAESIALEGDRALIGGYERGSGYVYEFARTGGIWAQVNQSTAAGGAVGDDYGCSLALRAGNAVIGQCYADDYAGAAYLATPVTANATSVIEAPGVLGNDYDPDGGSITATLAAGPTYGTVALAADGSFTYRPTAGWFGTDRFTYRTASGGRLSAPAIATIRVQPDPTKLALRYVAGTGGRISGWEGQLLAKGGTGRLVTAVPLAGYKFVKWSDGKTTAARRDTITANKTLTATFAKVLSKASIARTPNVSKVTYTRRSGVANFTLSARVKGWGGSVIPSSTVYLQWSTNGTTWSSTKSYKLKTDALGVVAKPFTVKTTLVRYYRWYVPAKSGVCLKAYSSSTKVTVK